MESRHGQYVVSDIPQPGVRVVRFVRPDLHAELDDAASIADCSLYRDLHTVALADLADGEALVLNLAMIEWFGSSFYRFLLKARETAQARNARIRLCCLSPIVREYFDIMKGGRQFEVADTEEQAVKAAKP